MKVLVLDEPAAAVVQRIVAEYLEGRGDRAIATSQNLDGIPCPSARPPEQNRHQLADGWQAGTVRSVLENPRYTGYAFFGWATKQEMLINPDDVAAGHMVKFRPASPDQVVRSRVQAHPEIVTVQTFTGVALLRRSKSAGGLTTARTAGRGTARTARNYLFRGLARCGVCGRKMQGATVRQATYYRCTARTLAPGSPMLAEHPRTVNLREPNVRYASGQGQVDKFVS